MGVVSEPSLLAETADTAHMTLRAFELAATNREIGGALWAKEGIVGLEGSMQTELVDVSLRAMDSLGQLRARVGARAFAVGWAVSTGALIAAGWGFFTSLFVGSGIGGGFAKVFLIWRKRALIEAVCRQYGISRETLGAERYLID